MYRISCPSPCERDCVLLVASVPYARGLFVATTLVPSFSPPPASVGRWKSQKMVRAVSDFGATMGDVNLATAMFAIANMHAHMGDCPRKAFLKLVCRCALWRCCCVVEMPLCGGHAAV